MFKSNKILISLCALALACCWYLSSFAPKTLNIVRAEEVLTEVTADFDVNYYVVRGDWEADSGEIVQTDVISSGTSYDRMIAYKDAYKNLTIEFEMLYVSASSSEAWCGVAFNKTKRADTMNVSGYLLALKDYGSIYLYNWNKTQILGEHALAGENRLNGGGEHVWHAYKIVCSGENISVFVDGAKIIDVSDATYSQGFWSLNSGDSVCRFKNVKVGGTIVDMTIYTQISDGGLSNAEIAARDELFDKSKDFGSETDVGSALAEGGISKIQKNYLEDGYVTIGSKTPSSYYQLFAIGIIAAALFVGLTVFFIIKIKRTGVGK